MSRLLLLVAAVAAAVVIVRKATAESTGSYDPRDAA